MTYNILLVDDDISQALIAQKFIEKDGNYRTRLVSGGQEAIDILTGNFANDIDLVLLDLAMPGVDGMDVLNAVKPVKPNLPIIINSGYDNVELITSAMKAGATDFIRKLDGNEKLQLSIENALRSHVLHDGLEMFKKSMSGQASFNDILGENQAIKEVRILGAKVVDSNMPVLIQGESGSGKELLARAIHFSKSGAMRPFISVNCGAIPANLLESILFGNEKGAFPGAMFKTYGKFREADGGTIFLNEVSELPHPVQVKLLRMLQDGKIDLVGGSNPVKINVRVIAASTHNLVSEVENGKFKGDLYYRLNVFPVYMPPLRNRNGDLPMMVRHFIELFIKSEHKNINGITKNAEEMLCKYSWPGNIRQLKNTIFRAIVLCETDMLDIKDFPDFMENENKVPVTNGSIKISNVTTIQVQDINGHCRNLADIEKQVIENALRRYNGHMSEVARRLGIGRSTLYRKLESYGVTFEN